MKVEKKIIETLLIENINSWIKISELARTTGLRENNVRSCVSELRREGHTIIGKVGSGYKLSNNKEEILEYAFNEIKKSSNIVKTYDKWIKKAMKGDIANEFNKH